MKKQTKNNTISTLAPLLLFVIFTTCVLSVLLTGANVYQSLGTRHQTSFEHRTITQYLSTRLHQGDAKNMLFIGDFYECSPQAEGNTLFICEKLNNKDFYTRIYFHNGYLYELFTSANGTFHPEDGEKILKINDLTFAIEKNLLTITVEYPNADVETLFFYLHSGEEFSHEK